MREPKCTKWKRGHRYVALRHKTGGVTFLRCEGCGLCRFKTADVRTAALALLDAARKVPIARWPEPITHKGMLCLGCDSQGSQRCKPNCWASRLERAMYDLKDALEPSK